MTPGILVLLAIWFVLVAVSIQKPWVGVIGYAAFAILCPPWNWRWGLPEWDYQKFLAGATLLGWLASGLYKQNLSKSAKLVVTVSALYILLVWVSSFQSINPIKTAVYWEVTWKIFLMCAIGVCVLNQSRHLEILAWSMLVAQGWNAFNVNQLYFQRGFINVNTFSWNFLDNNTYSISTLPVMAIAFSVLMTTDKMYSRLIAGLIFMLQMHQLMLLESRGTMLGAVALVVLGLLFMPKTRVTMTMTVVAFVLSAIIAGAPVIEEFSSIFSAKEELDISAESRYKLWTAGAGIMRDYPLLGVGPWGGEVKVPQYYPGNLGNVTTKALHNLFFEVGTGCGIPALICYMSIFLIPLWYHFKWWRSERHQMADWSRTINLAILCGVPSYWIASMFSSGALIESPYMLIVLGVTSICVAENEVEELESTSTEIEDGYELHAQAPA